MSTPYFALIGDVVDSRKVEDRAQLQRTLGGVLQQLNRELAPSVAVPLRLTRGDEVQGLLRDPAPAVEVLRRTGDEIHPERMAWGLGMGPLTTDLTSDIALVDGPCLHRAREAVETAARKGRWFVVQGVSEVEGTAVGAIMNLIGAIRAGWTEKELTYARAARAASQREVAERFGVNESTVSRALARARFRAVLEGEEAARTLLHSLSTP
jgi:DNA-binding CsgD family transcriptional regulator